MEKKKILSVPQVADQLGVSWIKVKNWIEEGKLRAVDINPNNAKHKRYFITEENLDKFLSGE